MQEYTFKYKKNFYFKVFANSDKEAVQNARKCLNETIASEVLDYLTVDLTAGGFMGRLYIEPAEITIKNICKRAPVVEEQTEIGIAVPF